MLFRRRLKHSTAEQRLTKKLFIAGVCIFVALQLAGFRFFGFNGHLKASRPKQVGRRLLSTVEWETCNFEIGHSRNYSDQTTWHAPSSANGWVALYVVLILIVFVALAIICDDFFVPSLEAISEKLHLSEDVAGATFMAAGSSAPELFTSIAGVAVESDVGVGTIVGSAVFNLLGICALSAAFAGKVLQLDWRPLSRDALFYAISILFFILFAWDGKFEIYESVVMLANYFLYIVIMKFNPQLMQLLSKCSKHKKVEPSMDESSKDSVNLTEECDENDDCEEEDDMITVCPCLPQVQVDVPIRHGKGCMAWLRFMLCWVLFLASFPFVVLFTWTIPNCSTPSTKKFYILSFIMSIVWIAALSFAMVTLVGRTGCILGIDKFTMGLVVVAIGTSIPDALSSVLVARDGYGDMAVSNAIGSNVFDIDLGIGLPFVISSVIRNFEPVRLLSAAEQGEFDRGDLIIIPHVKFGFILIVILVLSLSVFALVRFRLNKYLGAAFVLMYFIFVGYAYVQDLYCNHSC